MKSKKAYTVHYLMTRFGDERSISFLAYNKYDAYDKATFELIPEKEGSLAYATWVASVTYANGNYKEFNTFCGNPF